MADTKVSGLAAVAAFLTTHELPVNEAGTSKKVTGAQILALAAQGVLSGGYAQITANQTGITTQADVTGLTVTVTPLAGPRRIRITTFVNLVDATTTDSMAVFLMEGATQLAAAGANAPLNAQSQALTCSVVLQPSNAAHTYKVQVSRAAGAGSVTVSASATNPAYIMAEDLGAN